MSLRPNGYWDKADDVCVLDRPVVIFGDHTQVLKYVDFDFVAGADGVKVLAPKPFIDAKYLYYFVMANRAPSLGYARHYRHLKELLISYPDPDEQRRIVAVLDEAFEGLARARAHTEANLKNARELFERQLAHYFGGPPREWIRRKLGQITRKVGSGATPKGGAGAYKADGISLIRSLNVHDRWFRPKDLAFMMMTKLQSCPMWWSKNAMSF